MIKYKFDTTSDRTPSKMTPKDANFLMERFKKFFEEATDKKVSDIEFRSTMCDFLIWLKENRKDLPSAVNAEELAYLFNEYIEDNYK